MNLLGRVYFYGSTLYIRCIEFLQLTNGLITHLALYESEHTKLC